MSFGTSVIGAAVRPISKVGAAKALMVFSADSRVVVGRTQIAASSHDRYVLEYSQTSIAVFAISSVLMLLTFVWAVLQDYGKAWREPQRSGKVWEAALVDEKLRSGFGPEKQAQAAALALQIDTLQRSLDSTGSKVQALADQFKGQRRRRAPSLEFRFNTLKANVGVMETQLQNRHHRQR